jgi:hypothetical protein
MRISIGRAIPILVLVCACATSDPAPEPTTTTDGTWSYESLSSDERAVIDHERETADDWRPIVDAYARAVREAHAREGAR